MSTEFYRTADTVAVAFNQAEIGTEKEAVLTASDTVLITVVGPKEGYVWVSDTTAVNDAGIPVKMGEQLITTNPTNLFIYSNYQCTVFCTPGQTTAPA